MTWPSALPPFGDGYDQLRTRRSPSRLVEIAAAELRDPSQRCEHEPLEPERRERGPHFVAELAREEGELERLGDAAEHRPTLLGKRDRCLEQLLHFQCGADLDA